MSFDDYTDLGGLSQTLRPGALTPERLRAFDMGPVALSNPVEGLLRRAWVVEWKGGTFQIARATPEGWESQGTLFSWPNEPESVSLTFDQNGREVVAWDGGGVVNLWWYDPQLGTSAIREIGPGRCPLVLLDDKRPEFSGESDVLVFYIRADNSTVYLRQRERYNVAFPVPVPQHDAVYLELLAPTENNRICLWYSERLAGGYRKGWVLSAPFPFIFRDALVVERAEATEIYHFRNPLDQLDFETELLAVSRRDMVQRVEFHPEELILDEPLLIELFRRDMIQRVELLPEDLQLDEPLLQSISRRTMVIRYEMRPDDLQMGSPSLIAVERI